MYALEHYLQQHQRMDKKLLLKWDVHDGAQNKNDVVRRGRRGTSYKYPLVNCQIYIPNKSSDWSSPSSIFFFMKNMKTSLVNKVKSF